MISKSDVSSEVKTAPTVAVVVTNWNYGHFLAGCIDCVLAQTLRPDEVIVVDDGSTDGSLAILDAYADRIQVVRQSNGGQASAFNTGFTRSTGEIVLFLDADDLLRPEAIETIVTSWRPGLTCLAFWLELIDAAGRSRGIYEETLRIDEGDKRQRLITRGVFAFAPTSGNAFSRAFLDTVLPLDEVRWRISADLPLTYAAGLHGPQIVIPQALGAYRTHGSNNYYRERVPDAWRMHRGMRDVVDALALLADRQGGRGSAGDDEALLGLALRFAALRMRVKLQTLEGNRGDLPDYARRHLRKVLASTLPFWLRLTAAAPFAALGAGGWRWAWLRRWIADPRTRPAILQAATAFLRERRPHGLLARSAGLERPRWHALVPFKTVFAPDFNGLAASMMADGWSGEMSHTLHWSRGPKACLEFRLDPHPHALRLELSLVLGPAFTGVTVAVETTLDGRRLTLDHLTGHGALSVDLSREMLEANPVLRLELACAVVAPTPSRWRAMFAPALFFAIRSFRVRTLGLPPSFPLLVPGIVHRFGSLLTVEEDGAEWHIDSDGIAWIQHSEATCHIAVAPFTRPVALSLTLAVSEAHGWLRITCGDRPLFSGTAESGAELHCALAPIPGPDDTGLDLVFSFTPHDPTDLAKLGVATIGLVTVEAPAGSEPDQRLHLNIGERVALELGAAQRFASGKGWEIDEISGLANVETEASFALDIPSDCRDPILHLSLEPLLPEPDGHHHVVAVSVDQDVLVSARLQGVGSLDVPVPAAAIGTDGALTMTLHSIFVANALTDAEPALPLFAGVRLRAVGLTARAAPRHAASAPWVHAYAGSRLSALALGARAAITGERPHGRDALRALRARFASAIWRTDKRGLESQLMVPGFVDDLEGLGALAASLPLGPDEVSLVAAMETAAAGPGVLLRQMLCAMVLRIVPKHPALSDLRRLPPPLLWSPHPLARYLAQKSYGHRLPAPDPSLARYCETLLTNLLDTLQQEPQTSVCYRLAAEILEQFAPNLDGSVTGQPVPRLWAQCVELHLSRSGGRLAASPPPRISRPRLRIGVLIRETSPGPETGMALGIGRALDRDRFEPVLINLSAGRGGIDMSGAFDMAVDLMDGTVERSAATIRHLELDMLLIASPLQGFDRIAAIAAHRLAPVQMLLSKGSGLAGQLRSLAAVDLSGLLGSSRPGAAVPLPSIDAMAFAMTAHGISDGGDPQPSQPLRSASVVLVADASDLHGHWPLAGLWMRILAECPESELILMTDPMSADLAPEPALIQGVIGMECADLDVASSRVRVVDRKAIGADVMDRPNLTLGFLGPNAGRLLASRDAGVPFVALAMPGTEAFSACLHTAGLIATSSEDYVRSAVDLAGDAARRAQRLAEIDRALALGEGAIDADAALALNTGLLDMARDRGMLERADED